jgi:hypothetical protein
MVMNGETKREVGTFTLQAVKITKVSPSTVEAGSLVTVEGENFGNTAGSRDPNTMFGVNQVLINGIRADVRRWRPNKIEVQIPANAKTGDVEVRLASSDPLPDGSCCAEVEYAVSNTMPLTVIPPIAPDPSEVRWCFPAKILGRRLQRMGVFPLGENLWRLPNGPIALLWFMSH